MLLKLNLNSLALKIFTVFSVFVCSSPVTASLNTLASGEDLLLGDNIKINSAEYEKLISIKREKFKELLAFKLFASKAENNTAHVYRKTIKSAVDPSLIAVSDMELENEWQNFYSTNFKSKADYDRILELNYSSEEFLKAKLRDNIALEKYFNKIILPKLLDDLISEKLLFEEAKKRGYEAEKIELRLALESLEDDLGGKKFLYSFRNKHNLSEKDIEAYLERELLITKLSNSSVEEDLILEKLREIKKRVHVDTQVQVSEK